jgi:hypothetical protein
MIRSIIINIVSKFIGTIANSLTMPSVVMSSKLEVESIYGGVVERWRWWR